MTVSIPFLLRCLLSSSVDAALLLYNCKWCTGWDVRCLLCLHFSGWKKNEIPSELIIIWSAYFTYFLNLKSHESASKIKNKLKKQKHEVLRIVLQFTHFDFGNDNGVAPCASFSCYSYSTFPRLPFAHTLTHSLEYTFCITIKNCKYAN